MPFNKEAKFYNLFHAGKDYASEARAIRISFPDAKSILEIGAGTGKLTRELIKLGFKVTVIEPSKEMLSQWRNKDVPRIYKKIEDLDIKTFKKNKFDVVIALYDVLNYVHPFELVEQWVKMKRWGKQMMWEMWPAREGVKLFTHKKASGWHRFRFGIEFRGRVHLWFVYTGKGFFIEKHTLYLHGPNSMF